MNAERKSWRALPLVASLLVTVVQASHAAESQVYKTTPDRDLVKTTPPPSSHIYRTLGERKLQLAMHYPLGWKPEDRRPAVLFFSGAHKVQPDKMGKLPPLAEERAKLGLPVINRGPGQNHVPLCDSFAQRGLVCMRVEYRTRGKDGVLPGEDIADAVEAMRWVRRNATMLGIDPDHIIAAGGSSGAYLAASLFAFEQQHPADGDRPISARPNAIILYSPLIDWLNVGTMSGSFLVVLGGDKELGANISPARHWRKDMPPTLILVGTKEPPFAVVKEFADKWRGEGAPMELFIAEGGEHGFFIRTPWVEKTAARTDQFLHSLGYLKDRPREEPPSPSGETENNKAAAKGTADVAGRLAAMLTRYPEADANKDGVLTMEEAQAHRSKMKRPKKGAAAMHRQAKALRTRARHAASRMSVLPPCRHEVGTPTKTGRSAKLNSKVPGSCLLTWTPTGTDTCPGKNLPNSIRS
jgi:hypothetical protein